MSSQFNTENLMSVLSGTTGFVSVNTCQAHSGQRTVTTVYRQDRSWVTDTDQCKECRGAAGTSANGAHSAWATQSTSGGEKSKK